VDERIREVYEVSYPRLVVQMLALCGSQADAEEAVQEAFVQALRRRREFAQVAVPEAWLRTVALNRLRNGWRHAAVVRRLTPAVPGPVVPLELGPDHVAVVGALARIEPDLRVVIVLHHLADRSVADIAEELALPLGTVKSRLFRGRQRLASLLGDEPALTEEADHHA
jgi:RNA polymerase sigma factor (sigma-70 family)